MPGPQHQHSQGGQADTVPPMPQGNPNTIHQIPEEDLRTLKLDAQMLRDSAERIERAARTVAAVAASSSVRLSRKDKVIVGATALGLVGVGVGSTLLVQSIRRGRAARRMTMTTTHK